MNGTASVTHDILLVAALYKNDYVALFPAILVIANPFAAIKLVQSFVVDNPDELLKYGNTDVPDNEFQTDTDAD